MDFFNNYNQGAANGPAQYIRNSELPLFIPFKVTHVAVRTTAVGTTHQVNAKFGTQNIFFYLNNNDHERLVETNGAQAMMSLIANDEHPVCFQIKKQTGFSILFHPQSK